MTDPIADMLTRIRNGILLRQAEVEMPYSRTKHTIAKILEREGWLGSVQKTDAGFGTLKIGLRYTADGSSQIRSIRRISKPGHRVYVGKTNIPVVLSHTGIAIVSTSSGMLTSKEAKKRGVGGEVICEVY